MHLVEQLWIVAVTWLALLSLNVDAVQVISKQPEHHSITSSSTKKKEADHKKEHNNVIVIQNSTENTTTLEQVKTQQAVHQRLDNHDDMSYSVPVQVGSQTLAGILDTGSFDLLVFSTRCGGCAPPAQWMRFYNPGYSTSYREGTSEASHSFGSGDTHSKSASEMIRMGSLLASQQPFWEVVQAKLPILDQGNFQVIIGVGPPGIGTKDLSSAVLRVEPPKVEEHASHYDQNLTHILKDAKVDETIDGKVDGKLALRNEVTMLENLKVHSFSMCLGRSPHSPGVFIWHDKSHVSQRGLFETAPVVGEYTWTVQMDNMFFDGGRDHRLQLFGCEHGCAALVDSGTSLITVPKAVADRALRHLNTLNSDCKRMHEMPDLKFRIGKRVFNLPPSSYIGETKGSLPDYMKAWMPWAQDGGGKCELLLLTMDTSTQYGPMVILGMPFFREYYTTFELGPNARDKPGRFLHAAKAARGECKPDTARELERKGDAEASIPVRTVDLSRVQVSPAFHRAQALDFMTL